MDNKTHKLLLNLVQADWFCNASKPLEATPEIEPLQGWAHAIEVCSSRPSEDAYLEAKNQLTAQLSAHHSALYGQWNSRVKEIKPLTEQLIRDKLATPGVRARTPNGVEKVFLDTLRWDMLALCVACEYEDLVPISRYYELLRHWYLAGRFPCGWLGEVPDDMEGAFQVGKLAVL